MSKLKHFTSSIRRFLDNSIKLAAVSYLTYSYVGGFVVCYGPSMEPTLKTKDIVLTDHLSPRLGRIEIGDIVVARSPLDYNSYVCKRVVAGPGDIVIFRNKTINIPKDYAWLEGDNKDNSNDSRYYGPVPYSMIRRKCICRLWPEFDMDLETPSRYYLESGPTAHQKKRHILNIKEKLEHKHKEKQPDTIRPGEDFEVEVNQTCSNDSDEVPVLLLNLALL